VTMSAMSLMAGALGGEADRGGRGGLQDDGTMTKGFGIRHAFLVERHQ
jgi:hypothetical protein